MRVSEPLTTTDRLKIAALFPFVIVAAVVLGVLLRLHALLTAGLERLTGR